MGKRKSKAIQEAIHRTERTNNQKLVEWMNEIISDKNLSLGNAEQETSGFDRKQPDIIIRKTHRSQKVVCVIELKNPAFFDLFNEEELYEPARTKATKRRAPYFGTSNFRELVLFNTARANRMEPLEKQIVQRYNLSDIKDPDEIENPGIKGAILQGLERFLFDLSEISSGRKVEPKHAIDEILVYRLQTIIRILTGYYREIIEERAQSDKSFVRKLGIWFLEQGWSFSKQREDYEKAARQTAYLLVNKVLFYNAIQPIRRLDPLQVPKDLTKGALLQNLLEGYFEEILKLDYETIYSTDFIDQIAFPDSSEVVTEVKELIELLSTYDFTQIGYDVLGRIFEKLIPEDERHLLGQYFTNSDIVDLILSFCIRHESDKILDPSCGAGTFLVRCYQHKKLLNQRLRHEKLLKDIWGVDISKFPAHLTTINLAINDLRSDENYPRVIRKDFFDLLPDSVLFSVPKGARKVMLKGLSSVEKEIEHPRYFDAIVGNPPYTRHLEIEDIQDQAEDYKSQIRHKALLAPNGRTMAVISKRAGIYAYFFIHGSKFLKNGGRFGFIVANSWLDADFGKGLQEHFLKHYKIIAIIESKVERWFIDADVNTCIIILEKAAGNENTGVRNQNPLRFVYLKKPLRHFIPPAESMWEKEIDRRIAIDALTKTILAHSDSYENDELKIYGLTQKELWNEGFDNTDKKYKGAKWGKYIRAPEIFFKVSRKIMSKLTPISRLANVNEGKQTGANSFFYVKKEIAEKYCIEKQYLKKAIPKPRSKNLYKLSSKDIEHFFFTTTVDPDNLKGTGALRYIKYGEHMRLHTGNTYANKEYWYQFNVRPPADLLIPCGIGSRHYCTLNTAKAIASGSFTEIRLNDPKHKFALWAFFNSSLGWLLLELSGRPGLGGGMLKVDPTDVRKLKVLDPTLIDNEELKELSSLLDRAVGTVEEESRAEDHSRLDTYLLGKVLGISKADQEEIQTAVKELVRTRHVKAASVKNSKKSRGGIDLELLSHDVLNRLPKANVISYFREKIAPKPFQIRQLPGKKGIPTVENTLLGWQLRCGRMSLDCRSEAEARYLRVFVEIGCREVPIPKNDKALNKLVQGLEKAFERTTTILEEYNSTILQKSVRERFNRVFWAKVRDEMFTEE